MGHNSSKRRLKTRRIEDEDNGASTYCCKYCGETQAALSFLTGGFCEKSPNRRHQPYKGKKHKVYFCKYCGHPQIAISRLTYQACTKSPNGYHQPYEGEKQDKYFCKYCGSFSKFISRLTRGSCSASPNKHHQPIEMNQPIEMDIIMKNRQWSRVFGRSGTHRKPRKRRFLWKRVYKNEESWWVYENEESWKALDDLLRR